jgi:hypothetical protein
MFLLHRCVEYISIKFFFVRTHANPLTPLVLKMKGRKEGLPCFCHESAISIPYILGACFCFEPDHV